MAIQDYVKLYKDRGLEAWKKLQPRQKVIFSVLGAVVIGLFVMIASFFGSGTAGMVPLKVPVKDPQLAMSKLAQFGIRAEHDVTKGAVVVDSDQEMRAAMILASHRQLPRADDHYGFLTETDLSTTESKLKKQMLIARQKMLSETIGSMEAISQAVVEITPAANPYHYQASTKGLASKATVSVTLRDKAMLDEYEVAAIATIVGNSWELLTPENVSIVDSNLRPYRYTNEVGLAMTIADLRDRERAKLSNSIVHLFDAKYHARAKVEVKLDADKIVEESTLYPGDEAGKTAYEERSEESSNSQTRAGDSAASVEWGNDAAHDPNNMKMVQNKDNEQRLAQKLHDKIIRRLEKEAIEIDYSNTTAAVSISEEYADQLGEKEAVWKDHIAKAVGIPAANVSIIADITPGTATAGAGGGFMSVFDQDLIYRLVLLAMAIAAAIILLVMLKKSAPKPLTFTDEEVGDFDEEDIPEIPGLPPVDQLSGNMVREKVVELVRKNPKAAANLMRRWMILGK